MACDAETWLLCRVDRATPILPVSENIKRGGRLTRKFALALDHVASLIRTYSWGIVLNRVHIRGPADGVALRSRTQQVVGTRPRFIEVRDPLKNAIQTLMREIENMIVEFSLLVARSLSSSITKVVSCPVGRVFCKMLQLLTALYRS